MSRERLLRLRPRCYHRARLNLDQWHDDVIFGDLYAAQLDYLEAGKLMFAWILRDTEGVGPPPNEVRAVSARVGNAASAPMSTLGR